MPGKHGCHDDFIQLGVDEQKFLEDLTSNCPSDRQHRPPKEIIVQLYTVPYKTLLRLAENSPLITIWCELPVMQSFWEEIWAKTAGRKPTPREAKNNPGIIYRPLLPQTTINAFHLVRGTWLYDHANYIAHTIDKTDPRVKPLLDKAIRFHCFEAVRANNRIKMTKLYQDDSTVVFDDVIKELTDEIKFHGTPVLLLLSLSYYEAANLYAEENVITADHYLRLALMYVNVAAQVAELSANAIHNAYYGLGLGESNSYGWNTFAKWRDGILEGISANYRCVFEVQAQQLANSFIAQQINDSELIDSGYCTDQANNSALTI